MAAIMAIHQDGERWVLLWFNKLLNNVGIKDTNSPGPTETSAERFALATHFLYVVAQTN